MNLITDFVIELPLISSVISNARATVAADESLLSVEPSLQAFLRSDEPVKILNKCIAVFADDPKADRAFLEDGHILLCNDFGGPTIAIGKTQAPTSTSPLYSSTSEALLGVVIGDGFTYRLHDTPTDWNPDVFSSEVVLGEAKTHHCKRYDTALTTTSKVYDYASSGEIILKIVSPAKIGLMWEFDRITGKALRVHAGTRESTTLSFIMKFLSKYGNAQSIGAISHLVAHPFHHVRWDVAKALGQLDIDALSKVLIKLKDDNHPHVRAASQKMLVQLGETHGNY